MNAAIAIETADVVDAFRAAEKEAWDAFMREPTPENLLAHHSALRLLNREIESRVQAMLELGRVRPDVRKDDAMNALSNEELTSLLSDELAMTEAKNRDAKWWRTEAHRWFDMIWKGGHLSRRAAYAWLAKTMGFSSSAHIAHLDVAQCQQVVEHVKDFLATRPGVR